MRRLPRRQAGVTLIELMVAIVVGLILTLVVFGTLTTFESRKRTLTAGNDLEQAGQIALYRLDRTIRSAGAGLLQGAAYAYGCPVHVARSSVQILPRLKEIAAPFAGIDPGAKGVFRLAPILILPGQTKPATSGEASDAIVVMAGVPNGSTATPFSAAASDASLPLRRSGEFGAGDLALIVDQPDEGGKRRPCLLAQVDAGYKGGSDLPLATSPYATSVADTTVASYSDAALALRVGPNGGGLRFTLLGVGDANVLYSHDLLAGADAQPQAQADGVFEMHALYGVDTDLDGRVDSWVSPASGDFSLSALTAGDDTAAQRLQQILALRVGLLMRGSVPEKDAVTEGPLTLFADLDKLTVTRKLADAERRFRYRAVEQTIPLRNNLMLLTP